ncbi:MAG TPA: SDR family oxidoreductase [Acidimicrobiales bacterium]|jgi:NAD(P)-dependent dehydrogenase (short-subunit alcohol dehydrogenase family)
MDRGTQPVLVTGANSGIGLETVLHVARLGYRAVGSVRSPGKAATVAAAAAEAGVTVETVELDVTDADGCAAVIGELRPWAVVNNAGYSGMGAIEDVTDAEARDQLETMVVAPMRLARLSLPAMRERGGGRIVNVSSIFGLTTVPFNGWYQATKHALEALSDALRVEVARDGVKVVLVEPGGFKTGIWEEFDRDVAKRGPSSPYAPGYGRSRQFLGLAMPFLGQPTAVAKVIGTALTARNPRPRYLVGRDAQAIALGQPWVPTAVRDRVTRLFLGL